MNGFLVPSTFFEGGGIDTTTCASGVVGPFLQEGPNRLYLYNRDNFAFASGIRYDATIRVTPEACGEDGPPFHLPAWSPQRASLFVLLLLASGVFVLLRRYTYF